MPAPRGLPRQTASVTAGSGCRGGKGMNEPGCTRMSFGHCCLRRGTGRRSARGRSSWRSPALRGRRSRSRGGRGARPRRGVGDELDGERATSARGPTPERRRMPGVAMAPAESTTRSPRSSVTRPNRSISTPCARLPRKRTRRTSVWGTMRRFSRARTSAVRYARAALMRSPSILFIACGPAPVVVGSLVSGLSGKPSSRQASRNASCHGTSSLAGWRRMGSGPVWPCHALSKSRSCSSFLNAGRQCSQAHSGRPRPAHSS